MLQKELNEVCEKYNTQRAAFQGIEFRKEEIISILKECGFKYVEIAFALLIKNNSIIKRGDRKTATFRFAKDPTHISIIGMTMLSAKDLQDSYISKSKANKPVETKKFTANNNGIIKEVVAKVSQQRIDEEYCINFLKERGYKILKPVTEFKEI